MALIFELLFSRAGIAAMILVAAFGWHVHDKHAAIAAHDAAITALVAVHNEKVRSLESSLTDQHRQIEIATANMRIQVRENTIINEKEVTKYVTNFSNSRCVVPAGLVQHHDSAAANMPVNSTPAIGLVDADSGVALSRVESVVAQNYGQAHEWRIERDDCRARYRSAFDALARFKAESAGQRKTATP